MYILHDVLWGVRLLPLKLVFANGAKLNVKSLVVANPPLASRVAPIDIVIHLQPHHGFTQHSCRPTAPPGHARPVFPHVASSPSDSKPKYGIDSRLHTSISYKRSR
jgi:hypothetical protein